MASLCKCLSDCVEDNQPQSLSDPSSIVQSIKECHASAKQTVELCAATLATGQNLVACGESIQRSLAGAATDLDASAFAVIADLIDGDKASEARELASTMKEKSSDCISLSTRMIRSLEKSVDALPDIIESYVEKKAQQSVTDQLSAEERSMLGGIDGDADELSRCIDAIDNLKLVTAIDAGTNAFLAIREKSKLCNRIFEMIKKFASDVTSITQAISDMDASAVLAKIKDGSILRAIGLSKYIKQFAEGCKRVVNKIIELFQGAASKLGALWRALSHAKDVMVDSLTEVVNARSLCGEASERAEKLKRMTTSLGQIEAMKLIKSLSGDRDRSMSDATREASEVDASIERAASKMKSAARMVGDEYHNLPAIVTEGIAVNDTDDEVESSFGAKISDIDGDIRELEMATRAVSDADILHAATAMHRAMRGVPEKVDTCQDLVNTCTDFADRSRSAIDSFLGKWSLETAIHQIKEMCRLVSLAKLMEQLAEKIHQLVKAITTLLRVMSKKVQSVADQLQSGGLDSVVDAAGDLVSDGLHNMMGKVFGK